MDIPEVMNFLKLNLFVRFAIVALLSPGFSISVNAQTAIVVQKTTLPAALAEISGMIHLGGKLYGIPDSGNPPVIYEFDSTTGSLTKTITLEGVTNKDWEDITHDGTYIYVGDFGNNSNGNRQDLRFYRIPVAATEDIAGSAGIVAAADIETIRYTYEDQTDFTAKGDNNTAFDCEAVFYFDGYLHLFTKNWVTNSNTTHYRLKLPQTPTAAPIRAERLEDFNTEDLLITGASLMDGHTVALLGYNNSQHYGTSTSCAIWLITAFDAVNRIFSSESKKQKLDLGLVAFVGQLESISAVSETRLLLASEQVVRQSIVIQQRLSGINLNNFLNPMISVGLEEFIARLLDNQTTLTWKYNESDVSYFEIETSSTFDGVYQQIGKIKGNPSTTEYRFIDANFSGVKKFYRIKIVTSAKEYYSEPMMVKKDNSILFNLVAIPSPFTSSINVSFYSDSDQSIQLSIVDLWGRVVRVKQVQTNSGRYNYIFNDLQGLNQGIYFLTGRSKSDLFVRKIMKQSCD